MYTENDGYDKHQTNNSNSENFYGNDGLEYEDKALYDEISDEDDFYTEMKINNQNDSKDDKRFKKIIFIAVGSALLGVFLLILAIIIFSNNSDSAGVDIKLLTEKVILKVGETQSISYEVINATEDIQATFKSSNPKMVTVDNNGTIMGVGEGDSVITISFKSGRQKKEKKFDVIVVK